MRDSCRGVLEYIAGVYLSAAEIGIGHFPDVGLALRKRGLRIVATDIHSFQYDGIEVYVDTILEPNLSLYSGVEVIYSIRPPIELVPYMKRLARMICADVIIKPLSSEYPDGMLVGRGMSAFYLWRSL